MGPRPLCNETKCHPGSHAAGYDASFKKATAELLNAKGGPAVVP